MLETRRGGVFKGIPRYSLAPKCNRCWLGCVLRQLPRALDGGAREPLDSNLMRYVALSSRVLVAACLALLGVASCFAEPNGDKLPPLAMGGSPPDEIPVGLGGMGGETAPVCVSRAAKAGAKCKPVRSAEPLLSRVVTDAPQDVTVFVEDLYGQFKSHCGGCHVDGSLGGFHISGTVEFRDKFDSKALAAIRSNTQACDKDDDGIKLDPNCFAFMPPPESNGKPWSERETAKSDAVRDFATLAEVWMQSATPPPLDVFILPADKGGKTAYAIDSQFALTFTNLGTCLPDQGMVSTELERSCNLDDQFAALTRIPNGQPNERIGLPLTLDETDLYTLDSATLAENGVIGYAPTYPLWSDDAGKLRFVRVPRGQSIRYNPETRDFDIPANTRFYKTFLKVGTGLDGQKRYKKIETRLIVSRPDGGSLFGTYAWNEQETRAELVVDPLRNGEPFRDRLISVVVNDLKYKEIYDKVQAGELRNLTYELEQAKAIRHYAIPGSERCVQCHMGSSSSSFVLGFSPLQVNQRPCSKETLAKDGFCEGGVIQPTGPDEVSQLQRLIDYGVITGYDPAQHLIKLEDPQGKKGARPMRSPEELVAQGYMLGNCAHCHNPSGYPSVLNPELADLLDFLPSQRGGIFGFPLDRVSPRIKRGSQGEVSLPYITPSLRDINLPNTTPLDVWKKKSSVGRDANGDPLEVFIDAPWRSLIYRNVDTPFTYTDDSTIYPHMPLNTSGFDCRAPKIMGSWMASIPAKRKNPLLSEDKAVGDPTAQTDSQPYVEVKADEPGYLNAQAEARKRLGIYRAGTRYKTYCPDTSDIVDLDVTRGNNGQQIPVDGAVAGLPAEGVPDRTHYVVTDLTETPGPWNPRRSDWRDIIVNQNYAGEEQRIAEASPNQRPILQDKLNNEKVVVGFLQDLGFSERLRAFATTKVPFGFWIEKPECNFIGVPKLADYEGKRRRWMDIEDSSHLRGQAPVYEAVPGSLIFNMICVNCHGPEADSRGRQASTLQEMTGGNGRVANFRDGLFGPFGSGGENRKRVFGSDSLAARYLAWMALGGTNTQIPGPILGLVAGTPVLGEKRLIASGVVSSANMLQVAQALCVGVARMGANSSTFDLAELGGTSDQDSLYAGTALIQKNGDAEMWTKLCSVDNPPPVRALSIAVRGNDVVVFHEPRSLFWPQTYPGDAPVGSFEGRVESGVSPDNLFPWCIAPTTDPEAAQWLAEQKTADGKQPPVCPASFLSEANRYKSELVNGGEKYVDIEKWALRGAINAGLAVFLYLDDMVANGRPPYPAYGECEKL